MFPKKYLVIGTSAAALGVLTKLRVLDPLSNIICISDEPELPYNKCFLADYLSGNTKESEVYTKPLHFFEHNNITLMLGKRVQGLNVQQKKITFDDGSPLEYDSLFLGTGSSPIIPSFLKKNVPGVFTFHTLADSNAILKYVFQHKVRQAVVVGTGLSGIECADSLITRGIQVTVVGRHDQLLRRFINQQASSFIEALMLAKNVTVLKRNEPEELLVEANKVQGLRLKNGQVLKADMVIAATGLLPNNELAQQAGLRLQDGYLVVDDYMQTSDVAIWAGGDCCLVKEHMSGRYIPSTTWPDAMMQGMIAACAMSGQPKQYPGIQSGISSSFFGTHFVTAGNVLSPLPYHHIQVQRGQDFYHNLVLDDSRRLQGFLLVGQTSQAPRLKRALLMGQPL